MSTRTHRKLRPAAWRRRTAVAATVFVLASLSVAPSASADRPQMPDATRQADEPASEPTDRAAERVDVIGSGSFPSVSDDGRFVVFQGEPPRLGRQTDRRLSTIYLRDRSDGSTTELTKVPSGLRAGASVRPVLSNDGCTVAVVTEMALDVFRDDDGGTRWDVYAIRLPHCGGRLGAWELVSARPDGSGVARDDVVPDQTPALSRSGTIIAYVHPADHLFEADGVTTITLVDQTVPLSSPGRSQFVSGMPIDRPNTTFTHRGLDQPALSGDGRYVAYRSDARSADAVPEWGTGVVEGGPATRQVYVWDRLEADPFVAVRLVTALRSGEPTTFGGAQPTLSRDGRIIAFTSRDGALAGRSDCAVCPNQVYRLDRDADRDGIFDETGLTRLQMMSSVGGRQGNASSTAPSMTADGSLVAFVTRASNLQRLRAPGAGGSADGDVLVADARSGEVRRLTMSADGITPSIGAHARPQLSATGRVTVIDTLAATQLSSARIDHGRAVVAITERPTLSLADADVGTTVVGAESSGWFVGLVNAGPTAFDPATVEISDARFRIDERNSSCVVGQLVPPGGNCNVWFSYTPSGEAPVSATLTVSEIGFDALTVSGTISGSGGLPTLLTNPGGVDLGTVEIGAPGREFVFDVSNVAIPPAFVQRVEVRGAHRDDFAITTNNCLDRALNPRASCTVGVTFTPTGAGRRTALVEIFTVEGQSTSIILGGDADYAPEIGLLTDEVVAGGPLFAGGVGFAPGTSVSVLFGDTSRVLVRTVAGDDGTFIVEIPIAANERGGRRPIVAQSEQGAAATSVVEVIPRPDEYIGIPGFGLGG